MRQFVTFLVYHNAKFNISNLWEGKNIIALNDHRRIVSVFLFSIKGLMGNV